MLVRVVFPAIKIPGLRLTLSVADNFSTAVYRSFQVSAAQRPQRLSLTVEDSKGEDQEVCWSFCFVSFYHHNNRS